MSILEEGKSLPLPLPFLPLHSRGELWSKSSTQSKLGQIGLLRVMPPRLEYLKGLRFHSLFGQHVFFDYHD